MAQGHALPGSGHGRREVERPQPRGADAEQALGDDAAVEPALGRKVALLHSGLRLTERWDQYKRIRRGEAAVVLGTRSAVFAPLERLGLIILDEEQESSYESEKAPCYHARDIAKYRCVQEGARLVLGSATPTVETAYYARKGDYGLCRLTERFNQRRLPQVILASMCCI